MIDNRRTLTDALRIWLEEGDVLADARKLLNAGPSSKRSGLGDGQIANWKRGDRLPDTFVEGAALYHCAQARRPLIDPEDIGLTGSSYWQVFVVGNPEHDNQPVLDCAILRYWQDVRALEDTGYLTHVASRSIDPTAAEDEPRVSTDGAGAKDKKRAQPKVVELGRKGANFDPQFEDDGSLFVSWEIDRTPRDHGYAVTFPKSIVNNHDELVGGHSVVPVGSAHLLVFLPQSAVNRLADRGLPGNPHGLPGAFATLLHGSPARVMERYLGIVESGAKRDFRRLGPWFRVIPEVEQGSGSHPLPPDISRDEVYKKASEWVEAGKFRLYSIHVDKPESFLTYALVF